MAKPTTFMPVQGTTNGIGSHGIGPQKVIYDLKNEIQGLQIENTDLCHKNEQLRFNNRGVQDELAATRKQNKATIMAYEAALAQHQGFYVV